MYSGADRRTGFLARLSAHKYSYCAPRTRQYATYRHPSSIAMHCATFFVQAGTQRRVYLRPSCHDGARLLGTELLQGAVQDAEGVVEVHGVHRQPFTQVLAGRQPHGFADVAAAEGRLDVPLEGQPLQLVCITRSRLCIMKQGSSCHMTLASRTLLPTGVFFFGRNVFAALLQTHRRF